jgi:hypothetical protein
MGKTKPDQMPRGHFGWSLIDGEGGFVVLKDVLHNLSRSENADDHRYSQGVLVGAVSVLVACGMTFGDACQLCWQAAPKDIHPERVPESWVDLFADKIK